MATLSNPVYFIGGADGGDRMWVGVASGYKNHVVRYTLVLEAGEYATNLTVDFDSGNFTQWGDYASDAWKEVNDEVSLYFRIGTDPEEFNNAGYDQVSNANGKVRMVRRAGQGVDENLSWDMTLTGDAMLVPGVTYYLWIYPGYERYGYFTWYDTGNGRFEYDIKLSGYPGLAHINGTAYQCFVDNGSGWDLCVPYVDNGSTWDICC